MKTIYKANENIFMFYKKTPQLQEQGKLNKLLSAQLPTPLLNMQP